MYFILRYKLILVSSFIRCAQICYLTLVVFGCNCHCSSPLCELCTEHHEWLLSDAVDILPFLLLPLAGPEELSEEENEGTAAQ